MAYCGHCGAELVPGDEFCRSCGTALADVASVAGPPAETSARKKGRVALIVAAIVLGLLLLAGVVYLFAFLGAAPKPQVASTTGTQTSGSGVTTTPGSSSTGVTTPPTTTTKPSTTTNPATPEPNPDANNVTHQATFITKTAVNGVDIHSMTFDYVQFLTGPDAVKAATAHGTTADNDFFVVNDNPKLRTFPVASGVVIRLHPANGPQYSRVFTLSEFESLINTGPHTYGGMEYHWFSEQTYYINIKSGKVTRIENQWTP